MTAPQKTRNITVRLDEKTVRRAKLVAARRGTSVSRLLAEQIRELAVRDESFAAAQRTALAALARGYHMGGTIKATREDWHDRQSLR